MRKNSRSQWSARLAATLLLFLSTPVAGDEFQLRHGARLRGDWLNPDKSIDQSYRIRTAAGVEVLLEAAQVASVQRDRPAVVEYEERSAAITNTVDEHWTLAEWCRQQGLQEQRRDHLRQILVLDPQHVSARRALGYSQLEGRWVTQKEFLTAKGYVYYKGQWRLPQEVTLVQESDARRKAEQEWLWKLRLWRKQLLDGEPHHAELALERLRAIRDPSAIGPIAKVLREDRLREMRLIWIEVLSQIEVTSATAALLATALNDRDDEIFYACLDHLVERRSPALVRTCVEALRSKNNRGVNRAAHLLGEFGDPSAVSPLIDALVTTHMQYVPGTRQSRYTFIQPTPGSPTNFARTPATGAFPITGYPTGPQLSMPRAPRWVPVRLANQHVLEALVKLSRNSFGYNQATWRHWYSQNSERFLPQ